MIIRLVSLQAAHCGRPGGCHGKVLMMNDSLEQAPAIPRVKKLQDALRRARITTAARNDAKVELHQAELSHLEHLRDELSEVIQEIPAGHDQFELAILPATPPRFWVDMVAFVVMDRDTRTYRFLKDGRYGREILFETGDVEDIADRITDYIAHRILEREQALQDGPIRQGDVPALAKPEPEKKRSGLWSLFWAVLYIALGLVGAYLLYRFAPHLLVDIPGLENLKPATDPTGGSALPAPTTE